MTEAITKNDAQELAKAIDQMVAAISENEQKLDHSYAGLGVLLTRVKTTEAWRVLEYKSVPFHSFASYLASLRDRFGRKQSQLYAYTEVAERLLPVAGEEGLNQMGVSKALTLAHASRRAGLPVTPELLVAALDDKVTVKELKVQAFETYQLAPDANVKGVWFDFGGAYLEPSEKKEVEGFFELAERLLEQKPSQPDWAKRKDAILAAVREFVGTHAVDVYGTPAERGDA